MIHQKTYWLAAHLSVSVERIGDFAILIQSNLFIV